MLASGRRPGCVLIRSTFMSSMLIVGDCKTSWSRTSGEASRFSPWIGRVEKKTRSNGRPTAMWTRASFRRGSIGLTNRSSVAAS
jgi:hypothetical protein